MTIKLIFICKRIKVKFLEKRQILYKILFKESFCKNGHHKNYKKKKTKQILPLPHMVGHTTNGDQRPWHHIHFLSDHQIILTESNIISYLYQRVYPVFIAVRLSVIRCNFTFSICLFRHEFLCCRFVGFFKLLLHISIFFSFILFSKHFLCSMSFIHLSHSFIYLVIVFHLQNFLYLPCLSIIVYPWAIVLKAKMTSSWKTHFELAFNSHTKMFPTWISSDERVEEFRFVWCTCQAVVYLILWSEILPLKLLLWRYKQCTQASKYSQPRENSFINLLYRIYTLKAICCLDQKRKGKEEISFILRHLKIFY